MSVKYIFRLDDACENLHLQNWKRIEDIFDKYSVFPLVGIIPDPKDPDLLRFQRDSYFWEKARDWQKKKWTIALHGYNHLYKTKCKGINPIHARSEFAGLPFEEQSLMIEKGYNLLLNKHLNPVVFFAPSHTFDNNTISALIEKTPIRIISDTIAFKPYTKYDVTFVPQQLGHCANVPFGIITICLHPNTMCENDFNSLERFLIKNKNKVIPFPAKMVKRKLNVFDCIFKMLYFLKRRIKHCE